MTLKEKITEIEIATMTVRLENLTAMNAPKIMLETISKEIAKNDIKVGGDTELLAEIFQTVEVKKGNGGKQYLIFNGNIQYFPQARFGRFICRKG